MATVPKAPSGIAKGNGKECYHRRCRQRGLRRHQIDAIDLLHLSGRLGVIACHDDTGFSLDHSWRSDFLILLVADAREPAEKRNSN
jgi:hypothetical protein